MNYLERPPHATLLRTFAGHGVEEPEAVYNELVRRLRPSTSNQGNFASDPAARLIVLQGGWWYRAEYRVTPDANGSRVQLQIFNVARPAHWLGPVTGRNELRAAPEAFRVLLSGVGVAS